MTRCAFPIGRAPWVILTLLGMAVFLMGHSPPTWRIPVNSGLAPRATPTPLPQPTGHPPAYPIPWAPTLREHFLLGRPFPETRGDVPLPDSRFGAFLKPGVAHLGIDIPAPKGIPVLAVADGEVLWAGEGFLFGRPHLEDPYGVAVFVRHDVGWGMYRLYSLYAHMQITHVRKGQRVVRGQIIGEVGATGKVTGPHLHLEVRYVHPDSPKPDKALNPELWMVPYLNWGVLVGQVRSTTGIYLPNYQVLVIPEEWPEEVQVLWRGYRTLRLRTYTLTPSVEQDPLYQENFAVGNLPAGRYRVRITWWGVPYEQEVVIRPGRVTFFQFQGRQGFVDVQEPGTPFREVLP